MTKTALVTGGFGYVGAELVKTLSQDPSWRVIATSRAAEPPFAAPAGVTFLSLDLLGDEGVLAQALQGVDALLHLAAPNEVLAKADPVAALAGTAGTTARLLEACKKTKVRRFLYLSTAQVYGAALKGRVEETTAPLPRNPYAIAHRAAEDFVFAADHLENLVVRLANAVGAPLDKGVERWTLVANDLCRQAVEQGRLVLKSSGRQWRNFIALADVTAAIKHLLELPSPQVGGSLFNLGSASSLRVCDLAARIAALAGEPGAPLPIEFGKSPADESALDFRSDRLRASGWQESATLDQALRETLAKSRAWFAT